jgi:FtsH-binding integral membrane protein
MKPENCDPPQDRVMPPISEFELQYFIQTRREIDTEKQERNKLLNYAVLATSAFSLALAQIEKSTQFLMSQWAFCLYIPLLFLISGLVAARRMKLRQISDRWLTLYDILRVRNVARDWIPLEDTVIKGLKGKRYLYEDLWLHMGLSLIVYGLIVSVVVRLFQTQPAWKWVIFGAIIILFHFLTTLLWLLTPIKLRESDNNVRRHNA